MTACSNSKFLKLVLQRVSLSHFISHGLTNRSESWIQLRNNITLPFLFSKVYGSCFKSVICYQNSLTKPIDRHVFAAAVGRKHHLHQKGLRTLYTLIFHFEAASILMGFSPSILSAKEVVCPLNEKFLFGPQYAMINSVFLICH